MKADLIARDLITNLKKGKEVENLLQDLASVDPSDLKMQLQNDQARKAFWINLYNAVSLFLLRDDPCIITMHEGRRKFFRNKTITIAGKTINLDFILHHILQKSGKLRLRGLFSSFSDSGFEKMLGIEKPDPRVYFALNCGATSCPPLRVYEEEKIEKQLELATISFLDSKTQYFPEENIVTVSQIFNWYEEDFGKEKGVLEMLRKYEKIPGNATPLIIYNVFNWNPSVN